MTRKDYDIDLDAVCEKLEAVTRKVWDEDRASAVPLQAVSNELVAGLRRAEEIIASLRQELLNRESVLNREWEAKASAIEEKVDAANTRAQILHEELYKAKEKINSLIKDLEAKEEELRLFQEKFLNFENQKTAERAVQLDRLRAAEEVSASLRQETLSREAAIHRESEAKAAAMGEKAADAEARALAAEEELRKRTGAAEEELRKRTGAAEEELRRRTGAAEEELQKRTGAAEEELHKAKAKIAALMKDLEAKEEENAQFQEKCLKAEAQKVAERAMQMEKFIEEEGEKEREREAFWKQRQQTLENDFRRREAEFEKRQRELLEELQRSAEETRKHQLQKEMELMDAQKQLQAEFRAREAAQREKEKEYARKYEELEKLKQNLRAEIAELTRQHKGGAENK